MTPLEIRKQKPPQTFDRGEAFKAHAYACARPKRVQSKARPKLELLILRLQKPLSDSRINCPRYVYGSSLRYQNFANHLCNTACNKIAVSVQA